jgi:hypothetical protein
LQVTISDLQARLEQSIDLTQSLSRESSSVTDFICDLIDNLRFACPTAGAIPRLRLVSAIFLVLLSESILPSETVGSTSVGISTVYNL